MSLNTPIKLVMEGGPQDGQTLDTTMLLLGSWPPPKFFNAEGDSTGGYVRVSYEQKLDENDERAEWVARYEWEEIQFVEGTAFPMGGAPE